MLICLLDVGAEHGFPLAPPTSLLFPLLQVSDCMTAKDTKKVGLAQEASHRESGWWPYAEEFLGPCLPLPCPPPRTSKTGWRIHLAKTLDSEVWGRLSQPLFSFSPSFRRGT